MELEIRPIAAQQQEMSLGVCLKVDGARKWSSGGTQLEIKLSNELQIKATHIHEKSFILSKIFTFYVVYDTFKAVTKKLESCLKVGIFGAVRTRGSDGKIRTVGARVRKQGFRIRDRWEAGEKNNVRYGIFDVKFIQTYNCISMRLSPLNFFKPEFGGLKTEKLNCSLTKGFFFQSEKPEVISSWLPISFRSNIKGMTSINLDLAFS